MTVPDTAKYCGRQVKFSEVVLFNKVAEINL